ncbi:hypothetical protein U1Q18_051236 [Sarracenia purpurea var. burkii]
MAGSIADTSATGMFARMGSQRTTRDHRWPVHKCAICRMELGLVVKIRNVVPTTTEEPLEIHPTTQSKIDELERKAADYENIIIAQKAIIDKPAKTLISSANYIDKSKLGEQIIFSIKGYQLIGDGIIHQMIRSAFKDDPETIELLRTSPYVGSGIQTKKLRNNIRNLPTLTKTLISVGDMETRNYECDDVRLAMEISMLGEMLITKGVERIVMLPMIIHDEMTGPRARIMSFLEKKFTKLLEQTIYLKEAENIMRQDRRRNITNDRVYVHNEVTDKIHELIKQKMGITAALE